jgi:hypothetical protein
MNTPAKVALTAASLCLFGCAPGPAFFITKASCAGSDLTFPHKSLNGDEGLTDYSGSVSEETAVKMLANRSIKFIEQKVLTTVWNLPLGLIVNGVEKNSFAKLWIDELGSSSCIAKNEHIQFGVTYDLYTQGMKPSECLAGTIVKQPTGRYRMEAHYKELLGSRSVEYEVLDGFNGSKVASIQSSSTVQSAAAAKSPIAMGFHAGCFANQQTVANLFQESSARASTVPTAREIDTIRPLSGTINFVRTQISKDEFLNINSMSDQPAIKLASKTALGVGYRTVAIADGNFIGHYSFQSHGVIDDTRPLSTPVGVVVPGRDKVTFVWRTGEVQNLKMTFDVGKITETHSFRVASNKLLVFALQDWAKGWAVFEASLEDFDISVARRVMAEVAAIDESIKNRFVVQDGGLVRDMQTGLTWAQADNENDHVFAYASGVCRKKGSNWVLPSATQVSGIFLPTGSVRAQCGTNTQCYVSPVFRLGSYRLWSHDADDAGTPLMMNLVSGSLEANKFPRPDTATVLCVRSN